LIYLSGNGEPPGEDSVTQTERQEMEGKGHFIVMSYVQLKEWCHQCAEKSKSTKVRLFLEDFALYIREKFEGGISMIKEQIVIESATKRENISAAVAIGYTWPQIAHSLINKLASLSMECVGLDSAEWDKVIDFDINSNYSKFFIKKQKWKNFAFGFEFEQKGAVGFAYGIVNFDERSNSLPNSIEAIIKDIDLGKGEKSTTLWPWWQYFIDPYRNWNESESPWLGIKKDGDTVKLVASKLGKLIEHASKEIDEQEQ
jgi:hypothetical protein